MDPIKECLADSSTQHPLVQQFIKEKLYLVGVSPATAKYYRTLFRCYFSLTAASSEVPTKVLLTEWMMGMKHRGMRPASINTMVIAMNAYTTWLLAEGHLPKSLRLQKVKVDSLLIKVVQEEHVEKLVRFTPVGWRKARVYLAALTVLDTGLRLHEVLALERAKVDMESLLLRVIGKGSKERIVPFSTELRKLLLRWNRLNEARFPSPYVFPPQYEGAAWSLSNAQRAMYALWRGMGVNPPYGWHCLRHTFATNYLRQGGDIVRLSKILGHASVTTTERYVHLLTGDLGIHTVKTSPLHRYRSSSMR